MKTTNLPSFREVQREIDQLLKLIVDSLKDGTRHAREYADWQDESIDRNLAPCLVRHRAKKYLAARQQEVKEEEEDVDFERESVPNNGLCLTTDGYQIRILKSDDGSLPPPGPSRVRQEFYGQAWLFDSGIFDHEEEPRVGLVVHWTVDADFELEKVFVALPIAGEISRDSVRSHWDERIWTRTMLPSTSAVSVESPDLDIHLDEPATGTAHE